MPPPERRKVRRYVHSFRHNMGVGQTDGRTDGRIEVVKQYRVLRAMHVDER